MQEFETMRTVPALCLMITASAAVGALLQPSESPPSRCEGPATAALLKARTIALRLRPGTITAQELEREEGGTGLRYSFDILSRSGPFEVGVDAATGTVLENRPLVTHLG